MSGHLVSHSNIKTNRFYEVNLQKITYEADGKKETGYVCARCMKTMRNGKTPAKRVNKAIRPQSAPVQPVQAIELQPVQETAAVAETAEA